jgi:hypothetical protein
LIESNINLDIAALVEEITQQPVTGVFVKALQQTSADGHDPLKIFYFERESGYNAV